MGEVPVEQVAKGESLLLQLLKGGWGILIKFEHAIRFNIKVRSERNPSGGDIINLFVVYSSFLVLMFLKSV